MQKYTFYTNCPGCGRKPKYNWVHCRCKGYMEIWHDGDLQCSKCDKIGFILDWEFNCNNHGENRFLGPNPQKLIYSLACLSEVNMPMSYVFDIVEKIRKKCGI